MPNPCVERAVLFEVAQEMIRFVFVFVSVTVLIYVPSIIIIHDKYLQTWCWFRNKDFYQQFGKWLRIASKKS